MLPQTTFNTRSRGGQSLMRDLQAAGFAPAILRKPLLAFPPQPAAGPLRGHISSRETLAKSFCSFLGAHACDLRQPERLPGLGTDLRANRSLDSRCHFLEQPLLTLTLAFALPPRSGDLLQPLLAAVAPCAGRSRILTLVVNRLSPNELPQPTPKGTGGIIHEVAQAHCKFAQHTLSNLLRCLRFEARPPARRLDERIITLHKRNPRLVISPIPQSAEERPAGFQGVVAWHGPLPPSKARTFVFWPSDQSGPCVLRSGVFTYRKAKSCALYTLPRAESTGPECTARMVSARK